MLILKADDPQGIMLVGSGAGGDPRRYSALIDALARSGLTVLAAVNERFDSRIVTIEQLSERIHSRIAALAEYSNNNLCTADPACSNGQLV